MAHIRNAIRSPLLLACLAALAIHALALLGFSPPKSWPQPRESAPMTVRLLRIPARPVPVEAPVPEVKPAQPVAKPRPRPSPARAARHAPPPAQAPASPSPPAASRPPPVLSLGTLGQQITEVSTELNHARELALQSRRIVYLSDVKTNRQVADAYERAWQDKVQRVGNLNYPANAPAGVLMLAVAVNRDGSVYSVQVRQSSGSSELDEAARRIVMLASPFAPIPAELAPGSDVLVITRTWRFHAGGHLETGIR